MQVLEAGSADEWEDIVSNCFVPLRAGALSEDFHGRMDHLMLDPAVSVSVVTTDGTTADRTPRLAARAESDDLHLSLQRSSRGTITQNGRTVRIRPGSVSVYATDAPHYLDYTAPAQQQLIVQVSSTALGLPAAMITDATSRIRTPVAEEARVLYGYTARVLERAEGENLAHASEVAAITKDLAATMIHASFTSGRVVPKTPGGLLVTIRDFIMAHVQTVRIDDITSEFFISRRTLYNLFAGSGTTPGEFLRSSRLARAAARLSDATWCAWTISEIAAECGFADATTFTRAFRREYGCTPSEWRQLLTGIARRTTAVTPG